jgi:hypothetical protein
MTAAIPERFPIRIEPRYRAILKLFGVNDANAYVDLGDELDARFGWSRITTPLANCTRWSIEGPWLALTALGVRRSIRHGDVTFAGSPRGGVRVDFREPARYFMFRPQAIYVTVEDLEGFAAALAARGLPGDDRRRAETRPAGGGGR